MLDIQIDASEVLDFANRAIGAPTILEGYAREATSELMEEGVGYAQEYAPRDTGELADSIHITRLTPFRGEYGTDLIYAWMREMGGVIRPVNGPFLVFEIDGRLIFAREVRQEGTHYMERSRKAIEHRIEPLYSEAISKTLDAVAFGR